MGTGGPLALSAATPSTVNGAADCWPFASSTAAEGLILGVGVIGWYVATTACRKLLKSKN